MGIVYEAFDQESQSRVALKTLRRLDARSLSRLKNEFRTLQDVEHPNLVTLGELFEVQGRWFFTMELIEGVDFMTYVRGRDSSKAPAEQASSEPEHAEQSSVDDRRLRACAAQLACGLHALHCAGCVHRDVKPSNAMVARDGRVVLLDFGLATRASREDHSSSAHALGTVAYMAPEQAVSSDVQPSADWYSFGVLLYEALTGRLPYSGSSAVDVIMKKQQYAPPPPRARVPDVPPDLDHLCADLLRIEPKDRPRGLSVLERLGLDAESIPKPGIGFASSASALTHHAPFVGRAQELRSLRADFDAVVRGRPVAVTICGESGLGKTALIRELTQGLRAEREDVVVLAGRCYEREAVPYKAFDGVVDALSRYLRRLPAVEAAALLPANASLLPRVFPVLGRVEPVAQAPRVLPPVQDPHELRSRVFAALKGLLISLAERVPLVVVIDDLQWADPDSLLLLDELLQPPEAPPLLLLMAFRTDEATIRDQLVTKSSITHRRIELHPLASDEGALLARLLLERKRVPENVTPDGIAAEAQGHPFYIDELVRHVEFVGGEEGMRLRLDEAIWKRASDLPEPARRVLELVALAGGPLPEATMSTAAKMDSTEFSRHLSMLRVASLARTGGTRGRRQIEPYHDRVRQAVLEHLAPADRRELHERLALAIEAAGLAAERPQLLVRHLEGSGKIQQAAECAADSARRATRALAFGRATELYRTALRLGDYSGDELRTMRIALGDALANAGHCAEAAEVYITASVGADPGTRLECQRKAAQQFLIGGHIEDGLETLRTVLRDIGVSIAPTPRRALASLLWQRLKLRLRGLRWRERHESQLPPESLKRLDVIEVVAIGLGLVDTIRGMDFQSRGLLLALRTGERSRVAIAFCYEACFVATQGRRSQTRARALLDQAHRAATDMDDEFVLNWVNASEAMLSYFGGRFGEAATRIAESERRFRERTVGSVWELNNTRLFRLHALRNCGELALLRQLFDEYVRDAVQRGDRYMETTVRRSNAILCLVDDDPAAIEGELRHATWMPSEGTFHLQHWYELEARAQLAVYVGEASSAVEELAPSFDRMSRSLLRRVQIVRASADWLWARMLLATSATNSERGGRAHELDEVVRLAKRLGRERIGYATSWALLVRAALQVRDHPEQAVEHLREAIEVAEDHGLRLVAAAARRRLGEQLGGNKGARLVDQASDWMTAEGIVRPDRVTKLIAPGF